MAIELDGAHHFTEEGLKYDEARTNYLNSLNIKVIRFENMRILDELGKVLEEIKTTLIPTASESIPPEAGGN